MTIEILKSLLDTCFLAKRITESMPELPTGLKPRHMHVIECIAKLSMIQEEVRVSDVSAYLNITTPSVTKLINELETLKILNKYSQKEDKRVTLLCLTELGKNYEKKYVETYHNELAQMLSDVDEKDVKTVVAVIEKLYQVVQ